MDIDLLSKLIGELILENDRVGLPGLGDFVAEVIPATFSDKGYTINPPYRKIFFRKGQCSNNMLAEHYAMSCGISQIEADVTISSFISEMENVLLERKVIIFPGLGRLRATKENHIFFVAEEELRAHPSDIALEPISLKSKNEFISPTDEEIQPDVVINENNTSNLKEEDDDALQPHSMSYSDIIARTERHNRPKKKKIPKLSYQSRINIASTVILFLMVSASVAVIFMFIILAFFPTSDLAYWLLYDKEQLEVLRYFENLQQ